MISFLVLFLFSLAVSAQEDAKFSVKVSRNTISPSGKLQVEFVLENASGTNFQAPKFEDFTIIGGPSTASSMSFMNGEMTQSLTYTYVLKPKKTGELVIPIASVKVKDKTLKTEKVKIKVSDDIDEEEEAILQNEAKPNNSDLFGSDPFESLFRNNPFFQQQPQPKKEEEKKKKKKTYSL
jgi:hypothetical protein